MSKSFIDRRNEQLRRQGYDPDTLCITPEMLEHPELVKEGVWVLTKKGWVKKPRPENLASEKDL